MYITPGLYYGEHCIYETYLKHTYTRIYVLINTHLLLNIHNGIYISMYLATNFISIGDKST